VAHEFLAPDVGDEVVTIARLVNAFFRWEFNSCETIVKNGRVYPIDYANASPDVSLISLHYYFPWAIATLVKWCVFCVVAGRRMRVDQDTRAYFDVGDRDDLDYRAKLREYRRLADEHFQADEYREFCAEQIGHLDELMVEFVESGDFDTLLVDTVASTFPPHEQESMTAHYRGLLGAWARDQH
jgi:hypothetical protein